MQQSPLYWLAIHHPANDRPLCVSNPVEESLCNADPLANLGCVGRLISGEPDAVVDGGDERKVHQKHHHRESPFPVVFVCC